MLGTRRGQNWLEGLGQQLGQQLAGPPEPPPAEPVERMDPSALSARIGMRPKSEVPVTSAKSDGNAPWRKALRQS